MIHRPLREWQEFSGRLQAVNTVEVRPRVSGYVDKVAFADGARVKKGQLLFQIDPRPSRPKSTGSLLSAPAASRTSSSRAPTVRAPSG